MTDPVLRLDGATLSVEPGMQVQTTVRVRNSGTVVEGFRLTILGAEVSAWGQVHPAEIQVYPGQEGSAILVLAPPAGIASRSGSYPFAVRAESVRDATISAVVEGDLEVGRVFGLQSKLTPVTSSGRWRGRHRVELTNWGNTPVRLRLVAGDPDERLAFLLTPDVLDVPLGGVGRARLKVKARHPFLRGSPVRLPFQVAGEPDTPGPQTGPPGRVPDPRRTVMDGALTQRPILSRAAVALGAVAVLALAGLTAWSLSGSTTRPTYEDQGTPGTPVLSAAAVSSQEIELTWTAPDQIQLFKLYEVNADGTQTINDNEIDGGLNTHRLSQLSAETTYCFQLQAVRGEFSSPRSNIVCQTTAAAPPETPSATTVPPASGPPTTTEPSATSTGVPTTTPPVVTTVAFLPTDYVAIVFTVPADQAEAEALAAQEAAELSTPDTPAMVLSTADYPDLELIPGVPIANASYFVYVGPFPDQPAAQDYCDTTTDLPAGCFPVQPSPEG